MAWDWTKTDRAGFEQAVELLLERKHETAEITFAPDGRGGDEGIDFLVEDKRTVTIYQLKYYPDGFKTSTRSRKAATKASFETAMRHKPTFWTLVVPSKLTLPERKFVTGLTAPVGLAQPRRIRILDLPKLDFLLSKYPSIMSYLDRPDILDQVEGRAIEVMEARDGEEMLARYSALTARGNNLDPNWDMTFQGSAEDGYIIPLPKHAQAAQKSPLGFEITVDAARLSPEAQAALDRLTAFGTGETVQIPRDSIVSQRSYGPSFQWGPQTGDILLRAARSTHGNVPITIDLFDEDQKAVGSHDGLITRAGDGEIGGSLDATFYGGLSLRWELPKDASNPGECNIYLNVHNQDVRDALDSLELNRALWEVTREIHLTVMGERIAVGTVSPIDDQVNPDLPGMRELASDLEFLLSREKRRKRFPANFSVRDRVHARVARLLHEGHCTLLPPDLSFTSSPVDIRNDADKAAALRSLAQAPRPMLFGHKSLELDIAGIKVEIGPVLFFCHAMKVLDADAVLARIDAGTINGTSVVFKADPLAGIRAVRTDELGTPPTSWIPSPWVLTDVDEHTALEDARAPLPQASD